MPIFKNYTAFFIQGSLQKWIFVILLHRHSVLLKVTQQAETRPEARCSISRVCTQSTATHQCPVKMNSYEERLSSD